MCDFKIGDEVVAIDDGGDSFLGVEPEVKLEIGRIYTCDSFYESDFKCDECGSSIAMLVREIDDPLFGFCPCSFRKVQRCNSRLTLEAFFTVPGGFEEPKRPAKTRERV